MADLKPCPFCGGSAGVYMRYDIPTPFWAVACTKCGKEPPLASTTYESAIDCWNKQKYVEIWVKRPPDAPGHHMVLDND